MWDQITDEAFLRPAAAIFLLLAFVVLLKRINKVLLIIGLVVIGAMYFLNNDSDTLDALLSPFKF